MYNLELFVVAVYCLISDELYPCFIQHYGQPRQRGFAPALSDEECLTDDAHAHLN